MKNIKTFEDFMKEKSGKILQEDTNINSSRKASAKFSNVVSKEIQEKLFNVLSEAMNEAISYENDNDPEHTLETYLKECATCLGSAAARTMNGNSYFNTLQTVAQHLIGESEEETIYVQHRDDLKEYLDACIESMKEAFCDKLDEMKRSNYSTATLVLKNIKEEKSQIDNKIDKNNEIR